MSSARRASESNSARSYNKPGARRDKAYSCDAGDQATDRRNLFNEHEGRDRGDPQHIHHAADEQKRHQRPTAADTMSAMAQAER
jgi:hypothetical protein